jgi:hypothetical protein
MFSALLARQAALTGWSLSIRNLVGNESFFDRRRFPF